MLMRDGFSALIRGSLFRSFPALLITRSQSGMGPPMAARSHTVIATIVLLACAMPRPAHAENTEGVQNLSLSLFLVFPKRRGTRRYRVFVDYCRVLQGNPIGGKSQSFAYSQYLPFGFTWREPFGWRGGGLKVSAVSGAGRDLFPNRSGMPSPSRRRGTEIRFISIKPTSCKKRSTTSSRSASAASRPRNFSPRFPLSICSSTVGSTRCRSPSNSTRPSPAAPPPRGSRGKGAKIRD